MKRNSYYPSRQAEQAAWLTNCANKIGGYATVLGLTPAQVAAITGDARWLAYILLTWLPAVRAWALGCTDALTEAQTGSGNNPQILPVFTAPPLPAGVVPALPGALDRIFQFVQQIKDSEKCTDAIASDLGIVGSTQTVPDLSTLQPIIAASLSGNGVAIKWSWDGNQAFLDSCEIQVDRGDGKGYTLLTVDTTPNYTDTQAFPATLVRWTYRAIYRVNDNQVGIWSQPVSVTVPA